jgi:hypothetical protein
MLTRIFVIVMMGVSFASVMGASRTLAQGTVSWTAGYPIPHNAPPGHAAGAVDIFGVYTVNPGWKVVDASIALKPQGDGLLQAYPLTAQNNQIGVLNGGVVVPARLTVGKKTYEATFFVRYRPDPNPNTDPDVSSGSSTAIFVIQ